MTKASNTRLTILQKAFDLIYKKGYQTTSIDEIIATTNVTKGAFYYHFKTKDEMGIAVIKEIVKPAMHNSLITHLENATKPLEGIYLMTKSLLLENSFLKFEYGCPASNLSQEMAPWNTEFSTVLNEITLEWLTTIENVIKKEIVNGTVKAEINPKQVAYFVISGYWGIRNFGKITNNIDCYHSYLQELKLYLESLNS
ncbi:TetR/AcrR family transcriptional regulator [Zobellia roscoffensis]|uniref:TetR/AcrR family transcriptional regulator n=1 Tax=Zobellia roscoffensis TaxID=2779508 RepID=UPI001889DAE2|nr:TetR/AcrR family transcriptional regulator [Zobellia roscoffensis]